MAASRNHQVLKQTIRLFTSPRKMEAPLTEFEFDESEIFCHQPESRSNNPIRSQVPKSRPAWSKNKNIVPGSVPVNIPHFQNIFLNEFDDDDDDDDEEEVAIVPPHEVVMRRRAASLSVVEGVGRTLKGRDLRRVRNAIWARTGFQD